MGVGSAGARGTSLQFQQSEERSLIAGGILDSLSGDLADAGVNLRPSVG